MHLSRYLGIFATICLFLMGSVAFSDGKTGGKSKSRKSKKICITFDELPASRTFGEVDREAVNYLLLQSLKNHEVKAAGFVVGEEIKASADLLGRWLNEGHTLGNQGYTGQDYNLVGATQFIADIRRGADEIEPMLGGFGQKNRYFRFPYLHYGETVEARRAAELYLEAHEFRVCPASVIPEDYLYNLTLQKLGSRPDSVKYEQLLNDYINHVLDELERVERLAQEVEGRPVPHILQLRANRLNAVFLEEMLTALEDMGYSFISLDKALSDELYQRTEAYYGLKGIGYLDMIVNSDPDLLPAE